MHAYTPRPARATELDTLVYLPILDSSNLGWRKPQATTGANPATLGHCLMVRHDWSLVPYSEAALSYLPKVPTDLWTPVGLNERMRVLRYQPRQYFAGHFDGSYERRGGNDSGGDERKGERSFITCQLYLNEEMEGGATRFSNPVIPSQFI